MPSLSRWSPLTAYQLGTLAFAAGTGFWAASDLVAHRGVDIAMVTYALGCLYFLEDAFRPLFTSSPPRLWWGLNSYQLGSIAYAFGTVVWGVEAWRASGRLDPVACVYGLGCAWFLKDAFSPSHAAPKRRRLTDGQLGTVAFLAGTVAWGFTGGWSWTVGAFGLGCLFFLRHVFAATPPVPDAT